MVPLDYNLDSLRSLDFRSGTRFKVEGVVEGLFFCPFVQFVIHTSR